MEPVVGSSALATYLAWETPRLKEVVDKGRIELRERLAKDRAVKEAAKATARRRMNRLRKAEEAAQQQLAFYEQGMAHEGYMIDSDAEEELKESAEKAKVFLSTDKTKGTFALRRKFPKVAEEWYGPLPDEADIAAAKDKLNTVRQELEDAEEEVRVAMWDSDEDDYEGDEEDKELREAEKTAIQKERIKIDKKRAQAKAFEQLSEEKQKAKLKSDEKRRKDAADRRKQIKDKVDAYDELKKFKDRHELNQKGAQKQKSAMAENVRLLRQAEKAKAAAEETTRNERNIFSDWIYNTEGKPANWDTAKMHTNYMRFAKAKRATDDSNHSVKVAKQKKPKQ